MMFLQVIKKSLACYLFLSFSTFLSAQQELKAIDAHLDSIFGQYNSGLQPGGSVAIIEKNKPVFLKSYGHANLEYQIKNTPNTLFNAGDLAKQFTVFSVLLLEEQGKLSIQDDIRKYLPQLKEWPFEITLKHLMEQTSGLRDVMELKKWIGYQNGDVITKQDILDIAAKQKHLNFPSGSRFEYNRTGFVLLTEVVAKVSGMPYSEFVRQHVFTPLGMDNSVFLDAHTEIIQNRSYSYATKDDRHIKIVHNASFVGGTNLYTSVSDFAKWLQNMVHHKIGKPSFYEYLHTKIKLPNGHSNYTAGIFKEDSEGYWRIHLEGFDHGYTAYMLHIPEHDFSLVYFSNNNEFPHEDIKKIFWNWFNTDYSISSVKPFVASNVKFVQKSTTELQGYTGNYIFDDNYSFRKIVLENDTLFYVRNETNRTPIVPIGGNHTFKMLYPDEDNLRITFKNQGKNIEFRVVNGGEDKDYVTLGRKIEFRVKKQKDFSEAYISRELEHTIYLQYVTEKMQLTIGDLSMELKQVGENEYLAQNDSKVDYIKLQRDHQQNIIGVYLSGAFVRNLYYAL